MLGARRKARIVAEVYGAAVAACGDEAAAADVAASVLASGRGAPVDELRARAVVTGLRQAPAACFAAMAPGDREAVGLARLLGLDVAAVAQTLGLDERDVRVRLTAGLQTLALERAWTAV